MIPGEARRSSRRSQPIIAFLLKSPPRLALVEFQVKNGENSHCSRFPITGVELARELPAQKSGDQGQ